MLGQSAFVELVYEDASGSQAAVMLHFPLTTEVSEVVASSNELAAILASLTDSVLMIRRIKYKNQLIPLGSVSDAGSVAQQGVFYFAVDIPNPDTLLSIPGIKSEMIESTGTFAGYRIDSSNGYIASFIALVVESGFTNPFGDDIRSYVTGYLQSRR